MERNPHLLIEGCAIGCYAIGAKVAYIYIRGEFFHVQHVLERAIDEAYARGFLGKNILGSGFDCDVYVHRGAGAYEAGEETALLESLEGKRAQPRNKPPFPAVVGLYGKPTAVNNVETLCNVPLIVAQRRGVVRGARAGEERRPEAVLRQRPREAARRLRSVDEHHAARADRRLRRRRARRPHAQGGHPRRIVGADPDARSARHAGELRRRSRRPVRCSDRRRSSCSTTPPAWCGSPRTCCTSTATSRAASARRAARAPTGCTRSCSSIERGEGQMRDLDLLSSISGNIAGKTLCAFGDAAVTPVLTTLKHFRHEYEAHIKEGRCTLPADWRARSRWERTEAATHEPSEVFVLRVSWPSA